MLSEMQNLESSQEKGVGRLIQQWRLSQRLSLRTLAARAGVSHTTLGRWESGRFQPCLPELEATLNALNASSHQRQQALDWLHAPRAVLKVQRDPLGLSAWTGGRRPTMGDLLCAMRRRQRKTQAEVAARIGVSMSALSRWERGATWPAPSELQTLCYILDATEAEIAALTLGRFEPQAREEIASLEALADDIEKLRWWCGGEREADIQYLAQEAQLWRYGGDNQASLRLFLAHYAYRADYLSWWERFDEAAHYARRALELAQVCHAPGRWRLYAAIADARALVFSGKRISPGRGIESLRLWLPEVKDRLPAYEAWMLSDMAKYADLDGDTETALQYSARAYHIAKKGAGYGETFTRAYDYAALLLKSSRPQQAFPLLHSVPTNLIMHYARPLLTAAAGALAQRDTAAAHQFHERATETITRHQVEHLLPTADQLALQLVSA